MRVIEAKLTSGTKVDGRAQKFSGPVFRRMMLQKLMLAVGAQLHLVLLSHK
jgi:hypothetical protein